jgi:hypothetical protein
MTTALKKNFRQFKQTFSKSNLRVLDIYFAAGPFLERLAYWILIKFY